MLSLNTGKNVQRSKDLTRLLFGHNLNILMFLTLMSMGRKQLLFLTSILKIVDRKYANSNHMEKMHNDLKNICLAYCLVLHWIFKAAQLLQE